MSPHILLFKVWVYLEVDAVLWSAQCLPVKLFDSFQAFKVVLEEGRILFCHDFDMVWLFGVPAWPQQEDEALPLERRQIEFSEIARNLGNTITIV